MKIVLEIISHTTDTVNGKPVERYKLKLLHSHNVFVVDGFGQPGVSIKIGDVIENMDVVGKLSSSELCQAYYEAREIEERAGKRREVSNNRGIVHRIAPVIPRKEGIVHKPAVEQMSLF